MRIFRAKIDFRIIDEVSKLKTPKTQTTRILSTQTIAKGTAFIVDSESDLPEPVGEDKKLCYDEIVPKSMFINLSNHIKVKEL